MQEVKSDFKTPPPPVASLQFWSWYLLPADLADGGGKHELPPKVAKVDGDVLMGDQCVCMCVDSS